MTAYPLVLTAELEEDYLESPDYDLQRYVVIRLNGHEVGRTAVAYHIYPGDRDTLESVAAEWLAGLGAKMTVPGGRGKA